MKPTVAGMVLTNHQCFGCTTKVVRWKNRSEGECLGMFGVNWQLTKNTVSVWAIASALLNPRQHWSRHVTPSALSASWVDPQLRIWRIPCNQLGTDYKLKISPTVIGFLVWHGFLTKPREECLVDVHPIISGMGSTQAENGRTYMISSLEMLENEITISNSCPLVTHVIWNVLFIG